MDRATHCVCPGCGRIGTRRSFPRGTCSWCHYENPDDGRMPTVQEYLTQDMRCMDVNPKAFLAGVLRVMGVK